jgi:hypothetical protein
MAPFKQTRPIARHPGGAPSTYKPEYCQRVVDYMAQGYSLTAFAGSIRHGKTQVYEWITLYPDFAAAVEQGRSARVKALENKMLGADKMCQATVSIFALKNADPDEWREVRYASFEHNVNLATLSDEQLLAIASGQKPSAVGAIDVQYNRLLERPKRYQEAPQAKRLPRE